LTCAWNNYWKTEIKLNKRDKDVLEEIVALMGDCLATDRCKNCPFKGPCLSWVFVENFQLPSHNERLVAAQDLLFHSTILEDLDDDEKKI
jgi:hypothetical protein